MLSERKVKLLFHFYEVAILHIRSEEPENSGKITGESTNFNAVKHTRQFEFVFNWYHQMFTIGIYVK